MRYIYIVGLITLFFLCSCSNSSSNSSSSNSSSSNNQSDRSNKQKSINGVYSYSDSSVESTITVSGNSWFGRLNLRSSLGSAYDKSHATYSNGMVRDGILYDDSGYIELGSVNGTSLTIPIGSSRITHYK